MWNRTKGTPTGKDPEASRLHARRHDTTGNLQHVESKREREGKRERWKCHTVHPINMTSTEIRSQTTGLCMSTKLKDLKLFYHFELHYA